MFPGSEVPIPEGLQIISKPIGLSIDGHKEIHDRYRKDLKGRGSFDKIYKALKLLRAYEIEFNILTCITKESSKYPLEIYNFFKGIGIEHIQFTPLVERVPAVSKSREGSYWEGRYLWKK